MAFVSNRDGQWDIYVGLVTGGGLVRLTNDPNIEARPRWSPDGTKLLYSRLNESGLQDIWVTPAFPGNARRLIPNAFSPAWSVDGRQIAYSSSNIIWICDADGGNARQLTKLEPSPIFHDQPAFARTGQSLAFIRRRLGPRSEVALADLQTGAVRTLTTDDALALSPVWSPDDRFIYFSSSRGGTMNIWRLTVATSEAVQITAGQADDADIDLSQGWQAPGVLQLPRQHEPGRDQSRSRLAWPAHVVDQGPVAKRNRAAVFARWTANRVFHESQRGGARRHLGHGRRRRQRHATGRRQRTYEHLSTLVARTAQELIFYSRVWRDLGHDGRPAPDCSGRRRGSRIAGEAVASVLGMG